MKLRYTIAAVCAIALVAAPAAMAKSFSGTVSGSGISADYTIKNKGKKVCLTYGGKRDLQRARGGHVLGQGRSRTGPRTRPSRRARSNKGFAKALKKANKVKAKGSGRVPGEDIKGTLR